MIITDEHAHPIERPRSEDFVDAIAFVHCTTTTTASLI